MRSKERPRSLRQFQDLYRDGVFQNKEKDTTNYWFPFLVLCVLGSCWAFADPYFRSQHLKEGNSFLGPFPNKEKYRLLLLFSFLFPSLLSILWSSLPLFLSLLPSLFPLPSSHYSSLLSSRFTLLSSFLSSLFTLLYSSVLFSSLLFSLLFSNLFWVRRGRWVRETFVRLQENYAMDRRNE